MSAWHIVEPGLWCSPFGDCYLMSEGWWVRRPDATWNGPHRTLDEAKAWAETHQAPAQRRAS